LSGANDADKLKELATYPYKAQAIWFLNAFWHKHEDQAELLWNYVAKFAEFDLQNGANGCELDELNAHRFLEFFNETQTVREMRDSLRSTGAIGNQVRHVPIIHHLIYRFKIDFHELVNASQGDNKAEIEEAQRKLVAVQEALKQSEARAQEAAAALATAKAQEKEATARESDARNAAATAAAAKAELEVALAELKAQEDAYNNKTQDLTRKGNDESIGIVTRNKAKAELAQHLAEDPLPLRKAKITQEAAVKKAERTRLEALAAAEAAAQARKNAAAAAVESGRAKEAAEEAVEAAAQKVNEAEAFLQEVKRKPGQAQGAIWWLERELYEQRKYLPASRGGIAK
jgi:DNA repair exonuclease SbcCD ATPase subunit